MEIIYQPDTIVTIKSTGTFAQIKERCWCDGRDTPLHYEAWVSDEGEERKTTLRIVYQEEIEPECAPYGESPEEIKKSIDTFAEIIVNRIFKEIEEGKL